MSRSRPAAPLAALAFVAFDAAPAWAGMPVFRLADAARMRLETISFFLLAFLACAGVVRFGWNALRADFPRLPRLSYPKAVGLVGLWGLLFLLVLTMISGARELLTPGAWKPDGVTYTLATAPTPDASPPPPDTTAAERRRRMEELRVGLVAYAARNGGKYPDTPDAAGLPADRWEVPHPSGVRYRIVPGTTATSGGKVLAYEPELFPDGRYVLFADGGVARVPSDVLARLLTPPEGR